MNIKSSIPKDLRSDRVNAAITELKNALEAEKVGEGDLLVVASFKKEDLFKPSTKLLLDLFDYPFIFNMTAIEKNPSIAANLSKLTGHINDAQKILWTEKKNKRAKTKAWKEKQAKQSEASGE